MYLTRDYPGLLDGLVKEDLTPLEQYAIANMPDNHWLAFARKIYPDINDDVVLLQLKTEYGAP